VRSKASQKNLLTGFPVDQKQVRANVAVAIAFPFSGEWMIAEVGRKSVTGDEQP
jgi:hypothetical protein